MIYFLPILHAHVGILCKHILRVFNFNNIFILPPQYILNRWTKYAKKGLPSHKAPVNMESLQARCAHISRNTISLALKCAVSKDVVDHLENGIQKLASEVEDLLSKINLDSGELPHCALECTEDVAKTRISFRVPPHQKGATVKRSKSVLDKCATQKKSKNVLDKGNKKSTKKPRKKGNFFT